MSYILKSRRGRPLSGLGGASDCGPGQIWDANFVYAGLPPGQCVTQAQSDANKAAHPEQYGGGTTGAVGTFFGNLLGGLLSSQQPQQPVVVPSSGPSMTTVVLVGGGALLALALLMKSRSSD